VSVVALRPVVAHDEPFLRRLYADTREAELALLGDGESGRAFLELQFVAQQRAYAAGFPQASHDVVLEDGEAVGRLYVDRAGRDIHLVDIALLATHRGRGIGSGLLSALLAEARGQERALRLQVARNNRALALYERLGWRVVGEDEVYLELVGGVS
jgi:ribosomal protein S18 acetylase RimI-like enzyme